MKDIFAKEIVEEITARVNKLTPQSQPLWGTMNVAQMLAHCNVTYEIEYDNIHPKPGAIQRFFIKTFVKKIVVGVKPYKKNQRTAPMFLVSSEQDFEKQKGRLLAYINKTAELGRAYFAGKENQAFGKLSAEEWNNMFYKHLDHHLSQFGV